MKFVLRVLLAGMALLWASNSVIAQDATGQVSGQNKKPRHWWNESYPGEPAKNPNAKKLPLISVRENKFVDPSGTTILLRGLAISDPDKIESQGHWNKAHFERVKQTGARVVRIPVHPIAWRERTPKGYLALLDQAVEWCTDLGLYIDLDWHSIGNLKSGLFQDPMYETSMAETMGFWRTISKHYAGNHTVVFYELFNEPTTYNNQLGPVSWEEWKKINEDLIAVIRAFDREKIPLVAGFDWAYDLTPLHVSPIQAEGIGYVTHPYPLKRSKPWEPKWDEDFGFAAARYPVVATEFGYWTGKDVDPQIADYGPTIIKYLESRGISWFAWVYDPEWEPSLISSWDTYAPTESGKFFNDALQGKMK